MHTFHLGVLEAREGRLEFELHNRFHNRHSRIAMRRAFHILHCSGKHSYKFHTEKNAERHTGEDYGHILAEGHQAGELLP